MSDNFGVVRQCEGCGVWRHKTWFTAGERHCRSCQTSETAYLDRLAEALKVWTAAEHKLEDEMWTVIKSGIRPDAISQSQWRMLHMLNEGMSPREIGVLFGVTEVGAEDMAQEALQELAKHIGNKPEILVPVSYGQEHAKTHTPPADQA